MAASTNLATTPDDDWGDPVQGELPAVQKTPTAPQAPHAPSGQTEEWGDAIPGGLASLPSPPSAPGRFGIQIGPDMSGEANDAYFSAGTQGKIINAMGYGAQDNYGAKTPDIDPVTTAILKNVDAWTGYSEQATSHAKGFVDAFIRPAVANIAHAAVSGVGHAVEGGADAAVRDTVPVALQIPYFPGMAEQTYAKGVEDSFTNYLNVAKSNGDERTVPQGLIPRIMDDISRTSVLGIYPLAALDLLSNAVGANQAIDIIAHTVASAADRAMPPGPGVTAVQRQHDLEKYANKIASAGNNALMLMGAPEGVEGIAGVARTAEPAIGGIPLEALDRAGVLKEPPPIEPGEAPKAEAAPTQPADIHEAARQVAPEVFEKYDALQNQSDTLTKLINERGADRATDPRVAAAQQEISTILGKVGGVEDRLTKTAAARLEDVRGGLRDFLTTDTEDMAKLRQERLQLDIQRRDLAPQAAKAYRLAQERLPEAAEEAKPDEAAAGPNVPERPLSETMADIHRAEAQEVLPEHAAASYHATKREIEETVNNEHPELSHEFSPRPENGIAGVPEEGARPAGGPNAAGAVAGEGARVAPTGVIAEGGVSNGAEGGTASADTISRDPAGPTGANQSGQVGVGGVGSEAGGAPERGGNIGEPGQPGSGIGAGIGGNLNLKPFVGTGDMRTRGLAKSIEARAIANGLTKSIGNLPEYARLNFAVAGEKIAEIIKTNWDEAVEIAMGKMAAPPDVPASLVLRAVEEIATKSGDVDLISRLAQESALHEQGTTAGQFIAGFGAKDPLSPVDLIKDLNRDRGAELKATKTARNDVAAAVSEMKTEMKKPSAPRKDALAKIIESIKCDY